MMFLINKRREKGREGKGFFGSIDKFNYNPIKLLFIDNNSCILIVIHPGSTLC
jgi:hypothetical protein